jgi:FkbM family methyltransferase
MVLKFYYKKLKVLLKNIINKPTSMDEVLFSYLNPNFNILEAGAHNGNDTKRLSALTKNKVYAFEPVPLLFEQLKENTVAIKNVETFNIALSQATGKMPMYISSGGSDASSSLLKPVEHLNKNPEVLFNDTIYVDASTLDDWAQSYNVKSIDFMWLDMQGFEYAMLKESKVIFPAVKVLYTEISTTELYDGQALYSEYKEWLIKLGFKLVKEDLTWGFSGNASFVRD